MSHTPTAGYRCPFDNGYGLDASPNPSGCYCGRSLRQKCFDEEKIDILYTVAYIIKEDMNNMNTTTTTTTTRHHNIDLKSEVTAVGITKSPSLNRKEQEKHMVYTVEFWGIEPGSKQCQYGTGWTDNLELANSWAEQIRSGLEPEGTLIRILHACR